MSDINYAVILDGKFIVLKPQMIAKPSELKRETVSTLIN